MHATISWSYDALPTDVQTLFRQLSVFSGRMEPAREQRRSAQTAGTSVIDAMETLLDHHLVRRDDTSAESRFSMFETVREFGRDQLRTTTTTRVRRRHARVLPGVRPHRRARARRRRIRRHGSTAIETEHDNIRSALRWALIAEPEIALDLAGTMWRFWLLRGYASEGLDWIERSIAPPARRRRRARARALMGAGSMLEAIGDDEAAEARYRAGLRDWEALDDPSGIALAYRHLGNAGVGRGRYGEAIEWYERARRLGAASCTTRR